MNNNRNRYGSFGRNDYDQMQDRHQSVPREIRFVVFAPVAATVQKGGGRIWLIEGYGPTLLDAEASLSRNIVNFKRGAPGYG